MRYPALLIVLAALLAGGAATAPFEGDLIVPPGSPVVFQGVDEADYARFTGSFVLKGQYSLECAYECLTESDLTLTIKPEPGLARRLPRLTSRNPDRVERIAIDRGWDFAKANIPAAKRAAVLRGDLDEATGPVEMVVDSYTASLGCDASIYTARFVGTRKPRTLARSEPAAFGCGS